MKFSTPTEAYGDAPMNVEIAAYQTEEDSRLCGDDESFVSLWITDFEIE